MTIKYPQSCFYLLKTKCRRGMEAVTITRSCIQNVESIVTQRVT